MSTNIATVLNLKLTPTACQHIADSRMVRRFFQSLRSTDRRHEAERHASHLCGFTATIRTDGQLMLECNGEHFPASTQQMLNVRSWLIEECGTDA